MVGGVLKDIKTVTSIAADGTKTVKQTMETVRETAKTVTSTFETLADGVKTTTQTVTETLTDGTEDTVVKQEIVKADDKEITFPSEVRAGDNVRRKGEEIRSGDVCMTKGTLLHAPEINFLAALGIHKVTVFKRLGWVFLHRRRTSKHRSAARSGKNLRFEPLLYRSDIKRKRL